MLYFNIIFFHKFVRSIFFLILTKIFWIYLYLKISKNSKFFHFLFDTNCTIYENLHGTKQQETHNERPGNVSDLLLEKKNLGAERKKSHSAFARTAFNFTEKSCDNRGLRPVKKWKQASGPGNSKLFSLSCNSHSSDR